MTNIILTSIIYLYAICVYSQDTNYNSLDSNFTGILNKRIHQKALELNLKQDWNNSITRSINNHAKLTTLEDTFILLLPENYSMPCDGYLSSHFGPRGNITHPGVDLTLKTGDSVRSVWEGIVRYARPNKGGYGNLIIIRHYNGLETYYAHLSRFKVKENDTIESGELIGLGGSTGHSTGPHLHFEVRFYNSCFSPEKIFNFLAKTSTTTAIISKNIFLPTHNNKHIDIDEEFRMAGSAMYINNQGLEDPLTN
jgi:murein DD-endopeptidase MepM/ murein hydrolase activator NlpD